MKTCCTETTLNLFMTMFQVSTSPATAVRTRRDGEGEGYCRKWTTAAWRKWTLKDLRTALLQVRWRQHERKRTPKCSSPPSLLFPSFPPEQSGGYEKKVQQRWETNDHPTCSVFLPSPVPPPPFLLPGVGQMIVRSDNFP